MQDGMPSKQDTISGYTSSEVRTFLSELFINGIPPIHSGSLVDKLLTRLLESEHHSTPFCEWTERLTPSPAGG
jgi:hypothetical protein